MSKKACWWTAAAIAVLALGGYAAIGLRPWPSARLFRRVNHGGIEIAQALKGHVPAGVASRLNEHYDPGDADAFLDTFYPSAIQSTGQRLPAVVWVHGGAFVGGSKDQIASYLKILAARGFITVGVDYSLAPRRQYPTPIRQVNVALAYLVINSARLHIDPSRFFLAGDSAGAQIAAQLANVISVASYAREMDIAPSIERAQLRGVILYCGIYDPKILKARGAFASLLKAVSWSYLGTRDLQNFPLAAQFSVVGHVTGQFPPMFISVGNADPLAQHSRLLAATAKTRGVSVDSLFFPADYTPPLAHEYQFDLDTVAGQTALDRSIEFLDGAGKPHP
jgi:acetyl esterase